MEPILPSLDLPSPTYRIGAFFIATLLAAAAAHGEDARVRPAAASERLTEGEIARFCGNLAPTASEARAAYQSRQLLELEERVRKSAEELEQRAVDARDWVNKREAMMKAATDDVVSVYAKMPADSAASQLAVMDDAMAAAVLSKLNPRAASAILGQMDAEKAAKLAAVMAGASVADKS